MKNIYFTAGPSELYPTVPKHIKIALDEQVCSMSHRGEAFQEMFSNMKEKLKKFLGIPSGHKIYTLASANECWERIIENTVKEKSFHFVNGAFGKRFFEISGELKRKPEKLETEFGKGFDFDSASLPKDSETVCFTHNESSTGVALNLEAIYRLKNRYPEKLFAMDVVSSIPYVDIDYSLVDLVYFSVQKGFGLPAGMAILVVSEHAYEKSLLLEKSGAYTGSYHKFSTLEKFSEKKQTPETPNVLDIYLLDKVLDDMKAEGLDKIRKEIDVKANLLYGFLENNHSYDLFVKNKSDRSPSVVVVAPPNQEKFLDKLKKKGYIVGKGYGPYKSSHVRISNFPAHRVDDVKKIIALM